MYHREDLNMKHGKKYADSVKLLDPQQAYDPEEACDLVVQTSKAKFDETIELSCRLNVDPRHADQQVRGAIVLPHGTGKTVRVVVITKGRQGKGSRGGRRGFRRRRGTGAENPNRKLV